jgi:hypothetical protein
MVGVPWKVKASVARENGFPEDNPALEAEIQSMYDRLPALAYEGHVGQIANVLAAIEGSGALLMDGKAGRDTIELVTAIYAAGFSGQRVTLPLSSDNPFYTREGIAQHASHFHDKRRSVENFADGDIVVGSLGDPKN